MFWLLQGVLLQYAVWYHLCSQCDRRGAGWVPLLLSLQCCSAEHLNHLPEPVSDKPPIGGLGSEVPLNGVLCWKERKWSMTADHKLKCVYRIPRAALYDTVGSHLSELLRCNDTYVLIHLSISIASVSPLLGNQLVGRASV